MENASKALIIAGAILLAILLISLGILIYNQAQDTINNSGMDQAAISAFNNKFLKYEGKQSGSVVKSLINEAIASNADESLPDVKVQLVTSSGATTGTDITNNTSAISTSSKYTIEISTYGTDGMVSVINVMKNT